MNSYALTQDREPKATIVIAKRPTHAAMFGAKELQYHIYKISGAVLPIVTDDCTNVLSAQRPTRILVGSSAVTTQPEFASDTFKQQEYTVACPDGNTIVLMGHDAKPMDSGSLSLPERIESMPGFDKAFRFDHARPITVADFALDPNRGSLEAWVWLEPKKSMSLAEQNSYGSILSVATLNPPHAKIMLSRDKIGTGAHPRLEPVGDDETRIRYWIMYFDNSTQKVLHIHLCSLPFRAECDEHGKWHHILATYDAVAGKRDLLVDGESKLDPYYSPVGCPTMEGKSAYMDIGGYIGEAASGYASDPFKGAIDEVRLSKVVRKPNLCGPFSRDDEETILLFHLDEEQGVVSLTESVSDRCVLFEPRFSLPGLWDERGTLDAVYYFLENSCGVRWYAPGKIGEVCPSKPTLDVEVKTVPRRKPAMVHRGIFTPVSWFMVGPPAKPEVPIPNADRDTWMLRMRMGGTPRTVGHSLPGRCANYLDRYPGWFAHDGSTILTLVDGHGNTVPSKLCYKHDLLVNPLDDPSSDVLDERIIVALCKDARNYFEGKESILGNNHMKDCYSLVPADWKGWCKCQECLKRRFPSKEAKDFWSNDALSYSIHSFTRRIAREFKQKYPTWVGQKWFCQCAYGDYAYYPKWPQGSLPPEDLMDIDDPTKEIEKIEGTNLETFASIEPNVFTWLCLGARTLWNEGVQKNDRVILDDWRKHEQTGKRLGVYLYYNKPFDDVAKLKYPFICSPAFFPSRVVSLFTKEAEDRKYIGFRGMSGVHVEMSAATASFFVDQLELYLTFKLADNPDQNGAALIDEFFRRYYSPAAQAMSTFYDGIEKSLTATGEMPPVPTEELTWGKDGLCRPERMAGLLKLMADAVAATRHVAGGFDSAGTQPFLGHDVAIARPMGDPTVYAERVDLFRRGVWNHMLEGYCTYWNKQLDTPRLPLLKLHLQLLDSKQSSGLENVLKGLPWSRTFWPFGYGQKQEFGEPLLELLPPPSSWLCAEELGGVLIVADRDHAFLCDVAQQIGAQVEPAASGPVRIVELRYADLAGHDWQRRLFDHLAGLGHVNATTHQAPAVLILGWTAGFQTD